MPLHFFGKRVLLPRPKAPAERQIGALPYAWVGDDVAYLLITSRGTGKWLFPKGLPMPGLSPPEVAAHEAGEEAGVGGTVEAEPIGCYRDWKARGNRQLPIEVTVFPMLVEHQFDDWPESAERYRHWAIYAEVQRLLSNPELIELVGRLDRRLRDASVTTSSRS